MFDLRRLGPEALLFLLAGILFFTGLGSHSIHNADEARYFIVIDEMMEADRFDDFTLRGEPYFNKGPLRIGASHLLARAFGLNAWTSRIPSGLMGLVALGLVVALGRRFYGVAASRWAALVFITCTQFLYIHGVRSGEMESTLIAGWLGAIYLAALARERPRMLWACAVVVGLVGLVKHLAYIAPVGATVLLWLAMSGDWRTVGIKRIAGALLLAVMIPIPWHAAQIARHGMDFVNGYLGREVVERVSRDYKGGYGWFFYLSVIKDGMFPWSLPLPFALVAGVRSGFRGPTAFLLVLAAVMVGGLLIAQGDLSWYVMPVLPVLALLVGRWLAAVPTARTFAFVWGIIGLVLAVSPSNVMIWDVHRRFAIEGLIGSDVAGVLQGAQMWWPQIVVALLMLAGAGIVFAGREAAGRRVTLGAFAVFAIVHAALPLRTAFQRMDLDLLAEEVAIQPGIDAGANWVTPHIEGVVWGVDNSVSWVFVERAAGDVFIIESVDQRDPSLWCLVREIDAGGVAIPGDALRVGDWLALPPETP
jgi:4-amino-4-deoxy-L-arabinose transferase-like glycosyltransferase